jgi:hypothetical protein
VLLLFILVSSHCFLFLIIDQFASLKSLTIPYKTKLGANTFREIAKVCPHLEAIDIGYTFGVGCGVYPTDSNLMEAVERFPNLNSISFEMWNVTNSGISSMARALGDQLHHLKFAASSIMYRCVSDEVMKVIGTCCKNLKSFSYNAKSISEEDDLLTDAGIIALVDGCRHLETLSLSNSKNVTKEAFVTILDMIEQGNAASAAGTNANKRFALRKIDLKGSGFSVVDYPFRIVDRNELRRE